MMERTVVRGGKTYTMKVRGKTQKSAPAATATATDTEVEDADAAPYRETMHSLIATLRDIRDKVDAVSRDGLTPAMLAAITVDGLSAADVAYTLTGGTMRD